MIWSPVLLPSPPFCNMVRANPDEFPTTSWHHNQLPDDRFWPEYEDISPEPSDCRCFYRVPSVCPSPVYRENTEPPREPYPLVPDHPAHQSSDQPHSYCPMLSPPNAQ